jgi:protein-tyrosine phosphatase
MDNLRARLINNSDFDQFDYILAMDNQNLADIKAMDCQSFTGEMGLFLDFCRNSEYSKYSEVPDPYYGGDQGFSLVLDLIEDASTELLRQIRERL